MSDSQMCRDDHGHLGYMVQCPECKGWGRFDMGGYLIECGECGGTGEVWVGEEDFFPESGLTPVGADAEHGAAIDGDQAAPLNPIS